MCPFHFYCLGFSYGPVNKYINFSGCSLDHQANKTHRDEHIFVSHASKTVLCISIVPNELMCPFLFHVWIVPYKDVNKYCTSTLRSKHRFSKSC